jgi:hypothetical protein
VGEFIRDRLPDPVSYFESEGLKLSGPGKWRTTECRFHGGSDSLRINTETGGWVCMSCAAKGGDVLSYEMQMHGSEFIEAAKALGAWDEAVAPRGVRHKPLSFSPRAALEVLRFDSLHVAVAACNLAQGIALSDLDRSALVQAAARIEMVAGEVTA